MRTWTHFACPKGPCRYIVYTLGTKGFSNTYFRAKVYTIYLHGPFGWLVLKNCDLTMRAGATHAHGLGWVACLGVLSYFTYASPDNRPRFAGNPLEEKVRASMMLNMYCN